MTDLSIIIVNWNTRDLLAGCLESVNSNQSAVSSQQPEPLTTDHRSLFTEIIVVDNASTDGSAALVRERFPWVRLIENTENVGFARANNQAITQATGRYILLLNPDTQAHSGALAALIDFMEANPQAGAAGARLLNADGSLQPSCHPMLTPGRELWRLLFLERLWRRSTYPLAQWDTATPHRVEVIKGACLLLRRAALDQVGALDDRYFMYTEEVDLCYRLAQAGWELWWTPAAEVVHYGEASSRQSAASMYIHLYRSKIQFYRKFGGERRANRFKWCVRLAYLPRLIAVRVGGLVSPRMAMQSLTFGRLLDELGGM